MSNRREGADPMRTPYHVLSETASGGGPRSGLAREALRWTDASLDRMVPFVRRMVLESGPSDLRSALADLSKELDVEALMDEEEWASLLAASDPSAPLFARVRALLRDEFKRSGPCHEALVSGLSDRLLEDADLSDEDWTSLASAQDPQEEHPCRGRPPSECWSGRCAWRLHRAGGCGAVQSGKESAEDFEVPAPSATTAPQAYTALHFAASMEPLTQAEESAKARALALLPPTEAAIDELLPVLRLLLLDMRRRIPSDDPIRVDLAEVQALLEEDSTLPDRRWAVLVDVLAESDREATPAAAAMELFRHVADEVLRSCGLERGHVLSGLAEHLHSETKMSEPEWVGLAMRGESEGA